MKIKSLIVSSAIFIFSLSSCGSNPSKEDKKYTIVYDCDLINETIPEQTVKENEKFSRPTISPTAKDEYKSFDEYYVDGEIYDFNQPATRNIVVTCAVKNKSFKVSFDTSEVNESIPDQMVEANKCASRPNQNITAKDPTQKFVDYYVDNKVYEFGTPITHDLTIKCKVDDFKHTVTFDAQDGWGKIDGSVTKDYYVLNSKTILDIFPGKKLPTPTVEAGKSVNFAYWGDENGEEYDVTKPIYGDITLKAVYEQNWIDIEVENKNIDVGTEGEKITCKIGGEDVTASCDITVVKGYTNIAQINRPSQNKPLIVSASYSWPKKEAGLALIEARYTNDSTNYCGYLAVSLGSFSKLDATSLGEGKAKASNNEISGELYVPNIYFNSNGSYTLIEEIEQEGFLSCTNLEKVLLPDSVKKINDFAFADCSNIDEININDGITSIGDMAFLRCRKITSITIPEDCDYIGMYAFYETGLEIAMFRDSQLWTFSDLDLPVSVDMLNNSDDAAVALSSIYVDSYMKKNESSDEPNLNISYAQLEINDKYKTRVPIYSNQTVTYRSENNRIADVEDGYIVTKGNSGETNIVVTSPGGKSIKCPVKVCKNDSFICSDGLVLPNILQEGRDPACGNISVPEVMGTTNIIGIGLCCFCGSNSIENVFVPDQILYISLQAFAESSINYCRFSSKSSLLRIEGQAFWESGLKYIDIPDTVIQMGSQCFKECERLNHIHLSSNELFTTLENNSFESCTALKYIVIPSNVTKINNEVFKNCKSLKNIYYNGTKANFEAAINGSSNVFQGVPATIVECLDGDYTISK